MAKYEIMLILDPKADEAIASKLIKDVFGEGVEKVEKLERNELAYTIKKTNIAQYFLASVDSEPGTIREFTRRANIIKEVWRNLVISLDSERGLNRRPRENKRPQRRFQSGQYGDKFKKPFGSRDQREQRGERGERREYTPRENMDPSQPREFVRRPSGDRPATRFSDRPYQSNVRPGGDRPQRSNDRSSEPRKPFSHDKPKSDN